MPDETHNNLSTVADAYSRVAPAYAKQFLGELEAKPLDRALLDVFTADARGRGPILDLATGSGHTARYLHEHDANVIGIDVAPRMIEVAQQAHPGISFRVGNIGALDFPAGTAGGITCFYGIVHMLRAELPPTFAEWRRVLSSGAPVLLSFHSGAETLRLTDFLGEPVNLAWNFFSMADVADALTASGLEVEARIERKAYAAEHPSVRGYILARRTSDA